MNKIAQKTYIALRDFCTVKVGRLFNYRTNGKEQVDIITLGCSKNLVDSEHLMRQFEAADMKSA